MLVALKLPPLGFALICGALLLYLRPELPGVGSEDAIGLPSGSASALGREQENRVR